MYDGPTTPSGIQDLDYTTNSTSISAHWSDFFDPHSGIVEYLWAVGTCPGCSDVQMFVSVGLGTRASRSGLTLGRGSTYYVTVKGCNGAGLCTQVSTNGITVDLSPPIPGRVLDGCITGVDVQYQASRCVRGGVLLLVIDIQLGYVMFCKCCVAAIHISDLVC